ncbi:MAG: hypothetical protein E5W17_02095 [Mesorhizobium sp.]|nr:MAG: hypothetical protein E5W17_02095 [Mesorhizobium sp.]
MPSPAGISGNAAATLAFDTVLASLEDSKAENIVSIDIQGKSSLGDYMVIASGREFYNLEKMWQAPDLEEETLH